MNALELFRALGDESNRPPSPPKHILKKRKPSQGEKVKRYWPGKAPDFANEDDSYSDESSTEQEPQVKAASQPDRRLNRYNITQVGGSDDLSERVRRRKAQTETITVHEPDGPKGPQTADHSSSEPSALHKSPEQDQSAKPTRLDRSTLRRMALEYRKNEEQKLSSKADEPEEEESEESEYSDSSESLDEQKPGGDLQVLSKPMFVPKGARAAESQRELIKKQELQRKENERRRLLERKRDTKEMVVKQLQELDEDPEAEEENLIDDTDVLDEKEYELWKIRELKRILRDKEEREKFKKLEEELKVRRSMTDEERELDNKKVDKVVVEKSKLRFMQKYYHKGAFFMDKLDDKSEPLYARDFNAPTEEDLVDKSLLPKAMRVRRGQFGKQGRVKHTHLKDVDTTQFDAWSSSDKFKLAGTKQVFDRPKRK